MILNSNQLLSLQPKRTRIVTCCAPTIFIFVINFCLTPALIYYGPSIDTLTKDWGDSSQTETKVQTIYLSDYDPVFSVLIPLAPDKAFANRTEISNYFKDSHQGEFNVEAPKGYGVVAVVQILRMFTVSGEPTKCLDFIRFRQEVKSPSSSIQTKYTPKICGRVDDDDLTLHPKGLIGVRNFVSYTGIMATEIVIVSTLVKQKWEPARNQQFETVIAVEISYTAFPLRAKLKIPKISNEWNINNQYISNPKLLTAPLSVDSLECQILNDGDPDQSESRNNSPEEIEESENITWKLRPCLNFKGDKSKFLKSENANRIFCIHELLFCDTIVQCGFNFEQSIESEFQSFAGDELSCLSYSTNSDALDSELLSIIINSGTNSSSNSSNLIVVNGNRLNLPVIQQVDPVDVSIIQYFIIFICCVAGVTFVFGVLWWLRRSHRDFCGHKTLDGLNEVPDVQIHDNGIHPLPTDHYVRSPSIIAEKLEQMIYERRRQTLASAFIHTQHAKSQRSTRANSLDNHDEGDGDDDDTKDTKV